MIVEAILSPNAHIACSDGPIFNIEKKKEANLIELPINIIP
jgi:hypothetical protein